MDKIEQANEGKILGTKTTKFLWCCNDVPMLLLASSPFMAREGRTARERASEGRTREVRQGGFSGEIWSQANAFYTWALQD